MEPILTAVIPVAIIGIICAVVLVVASRVMAVKEDENLPKIRECLPGANCGACGFPGCDGYAKALCEKPDTAVNLCVPGGGKVAKELSELLGRDFAEVEKKTATVHCNGDCTRTHDKVDYHGMNSCKGAKLLYGGKGTCAYGCLGLGDCVSACPEHAICIVNGVAKVNKNACIGCGICVKTCPNRLITLEKSVKRVMVTCSNKDKGAATKKACTNGCLGCRRCERVCPMGAIKVVDNVAVIDHSKCEECTDFGICAKSCTSGCLIIVND